MPKYYNWTSHDKESVQEYFDAVTAPLMQSSKPLLLRKKLYALATIVEHVESHPSNEGRLNMPSVWCRGWRHFDYTYLDFALEIHNVRLELCMDQFVSHGQYSYTYSCIDMDNDLYGTPEEKIQLDYSFISDLHIALFQVSPGRFDKRYEALQQGAEISSSPFGETDIENDEDEEDSFDNYDIEEDDNTSDITKSNLSGAMTKIWGDFRENEGDDSSREEERKEERVVPMRRVGEVDEPDRRRRGPPALYLVDRILSSSTGVDAHRSNHVQLLSQGEHPRGDSAFCSLECRQQQMTQDERKDKCSLASKKGAASTNAAGAQVSATAEKVAAV
ncbi:UNVERIFIED_CONTAM: hypothetical protein Scaly_1619400 [Sesamum calycinum]|uniref:FLZ-type domain-containing protein n=1 Tax=Sesamum calycinum TaxID=2727403 RepID=A0AAW2P7R7_9LAMI